MSVERVLDLVLQRDPLSLSSDWNGTLVISALLEWEAVTGDKKYGDFAAAWFERHAERDPHMTDEEFYASYSGVGSEVIREGPIPFSAYCGHFGIVYPCERLAEKLGSGPVEAADAIASYILNRAPRSEHGCVYHDPKTKILIPDTCYYVAPVLAIAAKLTNNDAYMQEAAFQLRSYCELMQDPETGLAFTLWCGGEMPRRFWTRATGWLGGALVNTMIRLPKDHPDYPFFARCLERLAEGLVRVQREDGGFHVLLDQPSTPTDCTGPAMAAYWLLKGIELGILEPKYEANALKAWEAVKACIQPDGKITNAFTGWALDANEGKAEDFGREMDFYKGLVLFGAAAVHAKMQSAT
jgi:hypothetical protein